MSERRTNHIAIVTGTDNPKGIGAAVTRALLASGVGVLATYFAAEPEFLHEETRSAPGRLETLHVDLSDPTQIPTIFDRAEERLGPVDMVVNNACADGEDTFVPQRVATQDWAGRPLLRVTAETIDHHFAINTRAVALMMAEFASRFAARNANWGRIVNLSTGGAYAFPGEVSYGASKLALESYSRAAALELAPFGITVNIVSPGPTQTGWMSPEVEKQIAANMPMGRTGTPEDVAESVLIFLSERADWLTGQTLQAGGGHKM